MFLSKKFVNLDILKKYKSAYLVVPPFYPIDLRENTDHLKQFESLFLENKKFILRSSIQGESEDQINAGKSLSIKDISSYQDFIASYQKIIQQEKINSLILQEQILYNQHITGAFFDKILFLESASEKKQFCYLTENSQLGELTLDLPLFSLFQKISQELKQNNFLMELGLTKDKVYLFQLIEVQNHKIKKQLLAKESEVLNKEIRKMRYNFLEELLWGFRCFFLRRYFDEKKMSVNNHEEIIYNWRAIIHCYRTFSFFRKTYSFMEYYTWAMEGKSKWAQACKKHFTIASALSRGFFVSQNFIENYNKLIFLGSKSKTVQIGREAYLMEPLDPKAVYDLPQNSVVLTRSNTILSHGYLAVVEKNLYLVGNIPLNLWNQLKPGVKVKISFSQKKFLIL